MSADESGQPSGSTMNAAMGRRIGPVASGVLLILALLLAAVALQPWWLALLVAHRLEVDSGRGVHFDSMRVGLSWRLEPVIRMRGVRIANAPWADTKQPLVALGEMIVRVSWRSLDEGRPVLSLMVLRDGKVDLERQADGHRNWRLRDPENLGPGRYKVQALQAERASIRFKDAGIDLDLLATAAANGDAAPGDAALPTRIALIGRWRDLPFTADLATGPALTFNDTGETFALRGKADVGGVHVDAEGAAGDILHAPSLDARFELAGDSLAPFRAAFGHRHDVAGKKPFRLAGHFIADPRGVSLKGAVGQVGGTDIAGDVGLVHSDDRSTVRARLRSDSADAADLRWLVGDADRPAGKAVAAAPKSGAMAASAAAARPSPFAFARARDVDLAVDVRRLHAAELPWLRSLVLEAVLLGGKLDVGKLEVGVLQGRATGHGSFDMRADAAIADAELALHGIRLESLLGEQPAKKRITGMLLAHARIKAAGNSTDALLASATGSVDAGLTGGTLSALLDAEIGLQGGKILRGLIGGPDQIAIRCAAAAVDLRQGRGRVRTLVLDTERTRTTGTGTIDLDREAIDIVLTPEAKQGGLLVLDRSIRLHGPLKKPERELIGRAEVASASRRVCAGDPTRAR